MRSPKMTELMSGDYAVTGKLLSDVLPPLGTDG